ncbi:MAG: hypothetical protein ABEJ65_06480, partial [bacterium]
RYVPDQDQSVVPTITEPSARTKAKKFVREQYGGDPGSYDVSQLQKGFYYKNSTNHLVYRAEVEQQSTSKSFR